MGKERKDSTSAHAPDVTKLLAGLHLSKHSKSQHKNHGPSLPLRGGPSRKVELLETIALDRSSFNQMQLDDVPDQVPQDSIDYPMLLQISDPLRATAVTEESLDTCSDARPKMRSYISLLRSCGLTAENHYLFLKQWQGFTAQLLSSPVFDSCLFWSHRILNLSIPSRILHCAILAVAALHYTRLNQETSYGRGSVSTAYRLRAEAERRLRYHNNEEDHEVTVATHVCLMLFDYLTGNQEEWLSRILLTKLAMRSATFSSSHDSGRYFFWTVAQHDRLSMHMRTIPSVLDVDDLIWDTIRPSDESATGSVGRVDNIGSLYAELMYIGTHVRRLNKYSSEEQLDAVDLLLIRWKEKFPISLQTFVYTGELYDSSCFLHALTCNGGPRAIALHCLFSEIMILRLDLGIDFQRSKIHEHSMTICKLVQSLTTPARLLHNAVSSDLCVVLGSLLIAGQHLFSTDGKAWLKRLIGWIGSISGNLAAEKMTDLLELRWREQRTRPRPIILEDGLSYRSRNHEQDQVIIDLDMNEMVIN